MERIVTLPDGQRVLLEGQIIPDAWDVYQKRVNGHMELSFKNQVSWSEVDSPAPAKWDDYISQFSGDKLAERLAEHELELAERRAKQTEKNAARAKTQCRWLIKAQNLDTMMTLTYRENQSDRDLCKKHFKEWVRRMKAALGGEFVYVASFERQDRGAMHVHLACKKLQSHGVRRGVRVKAFELGTQVWRSIIGQDNGLCFIGSKTRHGGHRKNLSVAKLAGYVSKYIMKDYADCPANEARYSRSKGLTAPKAEKTSFTGMSLIDMVSLAFHCVDGDAIVSHSLTPDKYGGGRYWLVTEPDLTRF